MPIVKIHFVAEFWQYQIWDENTAETFVPGTTQCSWRNIFFNFKNISSNFSKHIWPFEPFSPGTRECTALSWETIWLNIFLNLNKYISQFEKLHFAIWRNIFENLDRTIWLWRWDENNAETFSPGTTECTAVSWETIWINIFFNLNKYISWF